MFRYVYRAEDSAQHIASPQEMSVDIISDPIKLEVVKPRAEAELGLGATAPFRRRGPLYLV